MANRQRKPRPDREPNVNLNLNVRGMRASATVSINERSNRLRAEGRRVFKLGLGQSPFPVPEPVVEALRVHAAEKDYLPVKGLAGLREAVAEYHRLKQGIAIRPEDVLVGPGSKELMFILQLVYYGDLVIPVPSWVSYAPQAEIVGRRIFRVPTRREDDWRLTPGGLERLCEADPDRPRVVILNYPNNPTGSTYKVDELKDLAEIARKYRVILVSDEIYGELSFRGQHVSIARFYPEGTIVSGGLSKWCGAGGWRLGVFAFPPSLAWLNEAMAAVASETFTSTCAPIQYAAVRAYRGGAEIEEYLRNSRRVLAALGRHCWKTLDHAGVTAPKPQGAFYLFADFSAHRERLAARGITTSRELCERILEDRGVAFLPGSNFGCREEKLTARLAYVDFDGAGALAAAAAVPDDKVLNGAFLQACCPQVVEAFKEIGDWLA